MREDAVKIFTHNNNLIIFKEPMGIKIEINIKLRFYRNSSIYCKVE